jgi:hypothetical protein
MKRNATSEKRSVKNPAGNRSPNRTAGNRTRAKGAADAAVDADQEDAARFATAYNAATAWMTAADELARAAAMARVVSTYLEKFSQRTHSGKDWIAARVAAPAALQLIAEADRRVRGSAPGVHLPLGSSDLAFAAAVLLADGNKR